MYNLWIKPEQFSISILGVKENDSSALQTTSPLYTEGMLQSSPLEKAHGSSGARFSPFAGWNLPLHYTSPLEEHRWVRTMAGIFDISHMGRISLSGNGVPDYLEKITTINVHDLKVGGCRYGLLLDSNGFIVDDVYLFRLAQEDFIFVVNASNRDVINDEFFAGSCPEDVLFTDTTLDTAMIALQGPKAGTVWKDLNGEDLPEPRNLVWKFKDAVVSRTGYTGEFGVEIIVPKAQAEQWWNSFLSHDLVKPAGLASRDSLRFEAGYMLYGHEISRDLRPCDTSLGWAVRKKRRENLNSWSVAKDCSPSKALIWFVMDEKAVPRQGYKVYYPGSSDQDFLGEISSGMLAPSLDVFAGNALVRADSIPKEGEKIFIEIRGTHKSAKVIAPPLYSQ